MTKEIEFLNEPFDSGPLADEEVAAASSRLIEFLDTDDVSTIAGEILVG